MTSDAAGVVGASAGWARDNLLGLLSARVLLPDGGLRPALVWVDRETGTIVSVSDGEWSERESQRGRIVFLGERVLAPGFVDVHVHGGAGWQVNGGSAEEVHVAVTDIAAFHARHGTTSLLATTVSDTPERLLASVAGVARAAAEREPWAGVAAAGVSSNGHARVLGCHLEGPFISRERAGAQDRSQIRQPDPTELARLLEHGGGCVRIVTLAPELEDSGSLIAECLDAGVVVSLGHSDADYECARAAIDLGASHVAHLFDAMPPLLHRAPGLVGAALSDDAVSVEVICDLHHVHPAVVALVAAAAPGRTALVTDASPAAGMPPGPVTLGRVDAMMDGGKVTLASDPRTLAGSALTMDRAVRHAVRDAHVPLERALRLASTSPARVVTRAAGGRRGLDKLGTITCGAPADLVVLDEELDTVTTIVGGRAVFDPGSLLD